MMSPSIIVYPLDTGDVSLAIKYATLDEFEDARKTTALKGNINKSFPNSYIMWAHIRITDIQIETADVDPLIQNNPGASTAPLQINRQAASFNEHCLKGLGFLAYAKDIFRYDQILYRMIGKM